MHASIKQKIQCAEKRVMKKAGKLHLQYFKKMFVSEQPDSHPLYDVPADTHERVLLSYVNEEERYLQPIPQIKPASNEKSKFTCNFTIFHCFESRMHKASKK